MKKLLKILGITLGVILLLLIITPVIFKSNIEAVLKEKVNDQFQATVSWNKLGLSLFRGFPDLSIKLHQVSVVGVEAFKGDTLAGLQRLEVRVNPFSALRNKIEVKSILVERPLINAIVLEDGTANWDIAEPATEEEVLPEDSPAGSATSMSVSLKRLAINGGRVYYLDQAAGIDASMEDFSLELRGDFSMEQTEMQLSSTIERINAKMGGIRYLRDGAFQVDLLAAADLVENRFTLKENLITLNGLSLGAEGEVLVVDGGAMEIDLNFFSKETSFQTLLSMVPAIYLLDFESLQTRGSLQLDGSVSGMMRDTILPDVRLNLRVSDGYFAYPDLPKNVSDVQIALHLDYKGSDMDQSLVMLEQFHLLLGGNPFDMQLQIDHPVSDMHVAGKAEGTIDFASLQDIVPLEDVSVEGRLETDLLWDTKLSYIEEGKFDQVVLEGALQIEGVLLETPEIPVPLKLERMKMLFNPRLVELTGLDIQLGTSDLHLQGELENFIPYIFENQTVSGRLALSSALLNASELIPDLEDSVEQNQVPGDTLVPVRPDSLAEASTIRIPENVDFTMTLDMQKVVYDKIVIENIKGKMRVMEGVAGLDNLRMDVIEGTVNTSGWVDTRGEFAEADLQVDMKDVDIRSAYETFVSVEKLMPMARFAQGSAQVDMEYHSLLDNSFVPLYESIDARGNAYTSGLRFYNLNEFVPLGDMLKNEKFTEMAPDEISVGFTVKEGRIIFNPFDMQVDDSKFTVSGSHGIDLSMDYRVDMNIAKSDLGTGANELMQGMIALAAGAGINIPQSDYIKVNANIGGTFNHPTLTTDLSGNLKPIGETVQEAVEEKISQEVERVEEEVREMSSEKAEKLIADAEKEAARLVEEAGKAGDTLVKEAELQGEKLVEEAGSNPLKQVAAKRAAGELKRQAEKQSATLVSEAEVKAAEIIQKARDEAEKL